MRPGRGVAVSPLAVTTSSHLIRVCHFSCSFGDLSRRVYKVPSDPRPDYLRDDLSPSTFNGTLASLPPNARITEHGEHAW
ncbi:hypothetical protein E2C01_019400 [Portunus trituberculatus]|uniref:Uncharacterized protein n=1 Tax=Portunus trituberculatus TaxID=210409 RepID=A0A5B7E0C2_PORTR|nr:hypothetical protein [Portunus trituberculatus]